MNRILLVSGMTSLCNAELVEMVKFVEIVEVVELGN